jgi:hypothetical protein
MFTSSAGYDPKVTPLPYVLEASAGETPREAALYDLDMRRRIDGELVALAAGTIFSKQQKSSVEQKASGIEASSWKRNRKDY